MKLRGLAFVLAVMFALLAVAIAVVGQTQPHLFMRLPMGFVLWLMTGHSLPPYFETAPLTEPHFRKWARDGDMVLATMAKSGTTWLQNIYLLLTHKGDDSWGVVGQEVKMHHLLWDEADDAYTRCHVAAYAGNFRFSRTVKRRRTPT